MYKSTIDFLNDLFGEDVLNDEFDIYNNSFTLHLMCGEFKDKEYNDVERLMMALQTHINEVKTELNK